MAGSVTATSSGSRRHGSSRTSRSVCPTVPADYTTVPQRMLWATTMRHSAHRHRIRQRTNLLPRPNGLACSRSSAHPSRSSAGSRHCAARRHAPGKWRAEVMRIHPAALCCCSAAAASRGGQLRRLPHGGAHRVGWAVHVGRRVSGYSLGLSTSRDRDSLTVAA
jgi:hypothetical protein